MLKKKRGKISLQPNGIVLNLTPLFVARQIQTPLTYLIKIGISNVSAQKMINNKSVQINFKQLSILCLSLDCTPNELFAIPKKTLPANHTLHQLRDINNDVKKDEVTLWLKTKSIDEVLKMIKE
jgi:DNA-binding Xre family transcriptional regulator